MTEEEKLRAEVERLRAEVAEWRDAWREQRAMTGKAFWDGFRAGAAAQRRDG